MSLSRLCNDDYVLPGVMGISDKDWEVLGSWDGKGMKQAWSMVPSPIAA